MAINIVVGGQYGSEGKGKVSRWVAQQTTAKAVIRVGGSNSSHSCIDSSGAHWVFRQLPTAATLPDVLCVFPAGSYIVPEILKKEIAQVGLDEGRILIDPNATVVSSVHIARESMSGLRGLIGCTNSGTGAAVIERIYRVHDGLLARNCAALRPFIKDTSEVLGGLIDRGEGVVIEGTQGFGLSLLHSPHYPYVTSRDTTASGFLSEAGLSPLDVCEIILVIRAFPVRVGGNSGPLVNETSWERISGELGRGINEHASVTGTLRRVARFDPNIVIQAIRHNNPTRIVLNHLDYIKPEYRREFIREVTKALPADVTNVGIGPDSIENWPSQFPARPWGQKS